MSHLLHPLIVDFIADEAAAAGDAEAEMPGATGNADTATRQTTHRTQMSLLADAAGVDLATFVQETATGSTLERLGLVGFRGGRDEVADINISRPMLFALRSNTLDDLKAGLFDEPPRLRLCSPSSPSPRRRLEPAPPPFAADTPYSSPGSQESARRSLPGLSYTPSSARPAPWLPPPAPGSTPRSRRSSLTPAAGTERGISGFGLSSPIVAGETVVPTQ